MITHRVTIQGIKAEAGPIELARENFEVSTDADAYFADLQNEGDIANALLATYPIIILTLEEQHLGEWVIKSRQVLVK